MNIVKITGTPRPTCFGSLIPGDLFMPEPSAGTIYMRLGDYRQAVDLENGTTISFKNTRQVRRVPTGQGVHLAPRLQKEE